MVVRKRRNSANSKQSLRLTINNQIFYRKPNLAASGLSLTFPNIFCAKRYFTNGTLPCFRCCMICFCKEKMFYCCMICLWKGKIVAVWFAPNSAKLYLTTYFVVGTPWDHFHLKHQNSSSELDFYDVSVQKPRWRQTHYLLIQGSVFKPVFVADELIEQRSWLLFFTAITL